MQKLMLILFVRFIGLFKQTPDKHLQSTFGCIKCSLVLKTPKSKLVKTSKPTSNIVKTSVTEYQINKAKEWYKDLFIEIKGTSYRSAVIIFYCKSCLKVSEKPYGSYANSIYKYECNSCSLTHRISTKTHTVDGVSLKLCEKYPEYYFYFPLDYKNKSSWIQVTCKDHGIFKKQVSKLLQGQSCFKCTILKLIKEKKLLGGYSDIYFENNPDERLVNASLYYVKIDNMYKVGITKNLKNRLKSLKSLFKKEILLIASYESTLYDVYAREQSILNEFKDFRIYTKESTELFKVSVDITKYFI